jgi:hypothetical protein
MRCPESIVRVATQQDWPYLLQITDEIRKQLLGHLEGLRTFGLGVARMQQKIHTRVLKLNMTAGRQRGNAAAAW